MSKAQPIKRWYINVNTGDCLETPSGDWMRVDDVEAVFPLDVAFMPVPRCEHCQYWQRHDSFSDMGECQQIQLNDTGPINPAAVMPVEACLTTRLDFGCVQFKPTLTEPAP